MQTPTGVEFDDFVAARTRYLKEECWSEPGTGAVIHICGIPIESVEARLLLVEHDKNGRPVSGEDVTCAIPYCPACETVPMATGMVYI
jgi:hypothetical protein